MNEITITLSGVDLASRQTAAVQRQRLLSAAQTTDRITVDLAGVLSISYSYADELFGVLAATQGWDWVARHVRLVNANDHALHVIAEIINRRLQETGQAIAKSA